MGEIDISLEAELEQLYDNSLRPISDFGAALSTPAGLELLRQIRGTDECDILHGFLYGARCELPKECGHFEGVKDLEKYCIGGRAPPPNESGKWTPPRLYDMIARFIGNCVVAHWVREQEKHGKSPSPEEFPRLNVWINYSSVLHSPMWDDEHPQRVLVTKPLQKPSDPPVEKLRTLSYHPNHSSKKDPWSEPQLEAGPIDLWYSDFVGFGVGSKYPKKVPRGLRYDIPPSLHSVIHNHPREEEYPILSSIGIVVDDSKDSTDEHPQNLLNLHFPNRDVAAFRDELSAHLFKIGKATSIPSDSYELESPLPDTEEVRQCVHWWCTIYAVFLANVLFPHSREAVDMEREALREVLGEDAVREFERTLERETALATEERKSFKRASNGRWFTEMATTKIHPDTQTGEDYGSLMVFSDRALQGATLEHLRRSVWPVFSYLRQTEQAVIKNWNLIHFSRQAAVANAAPRNMSHHIGSHVIPRASVAHISQRVITLGDGDVPTQGEHLNLIVSKLKDSLDQYIRQKADFLAELPTEPANSASTQYMYRDVLLPFLENTVLIDSLAANEGIRYRTWTDSALAIRFFVRSSDGSIREIRGRLKQEDCTTFSEKEIRQRFSLPYGLYPRWNPEFPEPVAYDIEAEEHDVSVALPGGVGQFAIYGILENLIRNAAKHNRNRLGKKPDLEVSIVVDELSGPDTDAGNLVDPGFYNLYILENLTQVSETDDGKPLEIVERLQDMLDEDIITVSTGEPRTEHWGMAEIVMCGNLLAGSKSPINFGSGGTKVTTRRIEKGSLGSLPADPEDKKIEFPEQDSLAFCFRILRAHRAVLCGPGLSAALDVNEENAESTRQEWLRAGVAIVSDLAALGDLLESAKGALAGYQFAVVEEYEEGFSDLRRHLPFRVIRIEPSADRSHVDASSGDLVLRNLFRDGERWEPDQAEALMGRLWSAWCRRWLDTSSRGQNPSDVDGLVSLYLEDAAESEGPDPWAAEQKRMDDYNSGQLPGLGKLHFRPWRGALESSSEKDDGTAGYRVFFDRHGGAIEGISVDENDCYIPFDKKSEDFNRIFHPRFPSRTAQRHAVAGCPVWTFPYELFEAGMLKVLVLDERVCERSMTLLDREDLTLRRAWGVLNGKDDDGKTPRMWHVAYRSNVFIATHVILPGGYGREGDRGEGERSYAAHLREAMPIHGASFREGEDQKLTAPRVTLPSLTVELRDEVGIRVRRITPYVSKKDKKKDLDSTDRKREDIDVIVIHQGLIDDWANAFGGQQEETLRALRRLCPWIIVESGRGMPSQVQGSSEKFLSYSALDRCFGVDRVAKLALCRRIMERTRAKTGG